MEIILEHVHKRYGAHVEALRDINLKIERGMFGLLGPNGAGKTTMLRILATLVTPSSGRITIGTYNLAHLDARKAVRMHLGYLPQELGLYPDLSGEEFLDYFGLLKGLYDRRTRRHQIAQLLEVTSLNAVAKRKIKTYSGGMKRRIGIAQALLGDPKIVIVDEPTAGLDPEERIRLRKLLTEMAMDRVIILSTHVVEDIGQTCENVAVLDKGEIAFQGRTKDLIEQARGQTWEFVSDGEYKLPTSLKLTTMLPLSEGILYRVVGKPDRALSAKVHLVSPTLEDGYVRLRQLHASKKIAETVPMASSGGCEE